MGTFVEVESLHGWRKRLFYDLSGPSFDWDGRILYFDRLHILFRIAEINDDSYWIYSVGLMISLMK
jgi:hypothetical protein